MWKKAQTGWRHTIANLPDSLNSHRGHLCHTQWRYKTLQRLSAVYQQQLRGKWSTHTNSAFNSTTPWQEGLVIRVLEVGASRATSTAILQGPQGTVCAANCEKRRAQHGKTVFRVCSSSRSRLQPWRTVQFLWVGWQREMRCLHYYLDLFFLTPLEPKTIIKDCKISRILNVFTQIINKDDSLNLWGVIWFWKYIKKMTERHHKCYEVCNLFFKILIITMVIIASPFLLGLHSLTSECNQCVVLVFTPGGIWCTQRTPAWALSHRANSTYLERPRACN